jgi:hypothetical protein
VSLAIIAGEIGADALEGTLCSLSDTEGWQFRDPLPNE